VTVTVDSVNVTETVLILKKSMLTNYFKSTGLLSTMFLVEIEVFVQQSVVLPTRTLSLNIKGSPSNAS